MAWPACAMRCRALTGCWGPACAWMPACWTWRQQLEVVSSVSVGVDNYDVAELSRRGVMLTNTPDVLTETTADTGFALILATARRVVELANWVRDGHWQANLGAGALWQ